MINPPKIIIQPVDKQVTVGNKAEFLVVAEGEELNYQWQRNGKDIPDANESNYQTGLLKKGDDAQFCCIVSNQKGRVTSDRAQLSVYETMVPLEIVTHPQNQEVEAGGGCNFWSLQKVQIYDINGMRMVQK